jgi:ATP-dependent Clp protease ATP-binding subunit ClpA
MFERLTEKAHAVIVATHEEAAQLGHGWIGTEHLVLGLARLEDDADAIGPRLLAELGPGEQAVRDHVLKRLPPTRRRSDHQLLDESPHPGPLRLVLERSSQAALRRGSVAIGSDHLLLGLLEESSCAGARLLAELGVTIDKVLARLGRRAPGSGAGRGAGAGGGRAVAVARAADAADGGGGAGGGAGGAGAGGAAVAVEPEPPPEGPFEPTVTLTAAAVPVLEMARQEAVQDGSEGRIGTQHYLLGLLALEGTVASRLLASFGVDYTLAKARLMQLDEEEPLEPPLPAPARAPSNTKRVEVPNDERFEALVGEVARLLPAGAPLGFNSDGEIGWIVTNGNVDLAGLVERARARIAPSA